MRLRRSLGFPVILSALALQGCASMPRDTRASYEPVTDITATATPMARIAPEAGEVVSVLQNRAGGVLTQRIVLKGDAGTGGENAIVVQVNQGPRRMADIDGPVPKPSESSIRAELDQNFATVDMELSQAYNHNSFGPFGYAIGHPRTNSSCIYAWQWSLGKLPRLIDSPAAFAATSSLPSMPTSVRVRLCRSNLTETDLVAFVRDMQVFPANSSDPYVDSASDSPVDVAGHDALIVSGASAKVYAAPRAEVARVVEATPAPRHAHVRRHKESRHARRHERDYERESRAATQDREASQGFGVLVPLPGGAPVARAASTAPAVNPLLAPLQGNPGRKSAAVDEMPLPGRNAPSGRAAAAPDPKPLISPIPLPN